MTRFVLISDTHNTKPVLPRGDILVHAGDLTGRGTRAETEAAMLWLGSTIRSAALKDLQQAEASAEAELADLKAKIASSAKAVVPAVVAEVKAAL